jgi:hypothetical protein
MIEKNCDTLGGASVNKICNNTTMSEDIKISVIENVFKDYLDYKMWVVCNAVKVPIDQKTGYALKWSNVDLYLTFDELKKWLKVYDNFGIFTGIIKNDINNKPYASVRCLDLDDVLEDGEPIHPKLIDFLNRLNTFVEISSSGKGLHAFIITDADISEFGFNTEKYWKGKYYSQKHFIKMTGNVFKDFNKPLIYLDKSDLINLQKNIGNITLDPFPTTSTQSSFNNDKSWVEILTIANIEFFPYDYIGKVNPKTGKICIESLKVECPNKENHKTDRIGDKSAHLAILQKWDDGSTSIKCNHHACFADATHHPNLLKKLWNKIYEKKVDSILQKMGWY